VRLSVFVMAARPARFTDQLNRIITLYINQVISVWAAAAIGRHDFRALPRTVFEGFSVWLSRPRAARLVWR